MGKRVSPAAIGMFVVGSLFLVLASLVVLSSGKLFSKPHIFICFFQGSLNGLKIGSAVKFRGVEIGTVKDIMLRLPASYGTVKPEAGIVLPVLVEIRETQLRKR